MFDANMRGIPKGRKFFAEVYSTNKKLKNLGVSSGDLIYCHMLNSNNENPCVDMMIGGHLTAVANDTDFDEKWLVYAGNADGTSFICDKLKVRASKILRQLSDNNQTNKG